MKLPGSFMRYWIAGLMVAGGLLPRGALAQGDRYAQLGPNGEPLFRAAHRILLRLAGSKDVAVSDLRSVGFFKGNPVNSEGACAENFHAAFDCFALYVPDIGNGNESGSWFEMAWRWGVPKTDWDSARARVPSLNGVATGPSGSFAGWTVSDPLASGTDEANAGDGSLGLHHAGVQSTADGSCLDHRNSWGSGNPLLAGSNCPATWGAEGWKGARPVPLDVYLAHYNATPAAFQWEWWQVTDAELDAAGVAPPTATSAGKTIGNFQTYGYNSDYTGEILCGTATIRSYGSIIPSSSQVVPGGCSGTATRSGWPLGLELRFDAFMFQLPALKDIMYEQVLIVNNSQKVYGVGLDYDSLYIDFRNGWYHTEQRSFIYHVPSQGATYAIRGPIVPCAAARQVVDLTCATQCLAVGCVKGFASGAEAIVMLKSPIGDLRNKLFSRPSSPFYNPGLPQAGDTLTFNQGHLCGFRACARVTSRTSPATTPEHERWVFGLISSTESNVLANRTSAGLGGTVPGQIYWHLFRAAGFGSGNPDCFPGQNPALGMCWNRYVPPGSWDYNHDGTLDTLHLDGCFLTGCASLWSDSLPAIAGVAGKMPTYGNVGGVMGVGPIKLKAGDTTAFVMAVTQATDSTGIMAQVAAAIDNYMAFYLAPDAAPKCKFVGVARAPAAAAQPSITGSWNTSCFAGQWVDPFLDKQYKDLVAAAAPALVRLRQLNPWLKDTLLFLSGNNLANLFLFKSCDGGQTWTSDADCTGNVATGAPFNDLGFLPYATFSADAPAGIPGSFTDRNVLPGLTYTYNLVGQTRGANFQVQNGDSTTVVGGDTVCVKNCRVESLALAPALFNGLSGSTGDPNVSRVYMAVSRQAGAVAATVDLVSRAGPLNASRIVFNVSSDSLTPANHRVLFGDSVFATRVDTIDRASKLLRAVATRVVRYAGTVPDTIRGTNIGGFTPSGETPGTTTFTLVGTDSVVTTTPSWPTGPVVVLTREGLGGGALLVSSTLSGDAATPVSFHTNLSYPSFDVSVDASLANKFDESFFLPDTLSATRVPALVEPTVAWQNVNAVQDQVRSSNQANGDYRIVWGARPFGNGGAGGTDQFQLDFSNPSASAAAITASLSARTAASLGATDTATARAISQSLGQPSFTTDSLVAVKLPFTIRNLSYGRPVTVAMRARTTPKTILVGVGQDTISVSVPNDAWVPGDPLFLVEPITGVPQVTFRQAVIACGSGFTRPSCNPVYPLTRGATVYLGETPGQVNRFGYFTPITSASSFTFQAVPAVRGVALTGSQVSGGLAAVRVVPNPYVMLSQYPGNGIMFTHMPPRGVLRIYTVAGQFVQQITWDESDLAGDGDLAWNLRSREGNLVAGGLYIYVLTASDASGNLAGTRTDKFVIIR